MLHDNWGAIEAGDFGLLEEHMKLLLPRLGKHITLRRAAWLQAEGMQVYSSSPSSKLHPRAAIPHASVRKKEVNHIQVSADKHPMR